MAVVALNVVMAVRDAGVLKLIYQPVAPESADTDLLDQPTIDPPPLDPP